MSHVLALLLAAGGYAGASGSLSVTGQIVPMAYVDLSNPDGGSLIACIDEIRDAFDGPADFEETKTMLALGGIQYERHESE